VSSINAVTVEIEKFLRSKEPQVLCITGDWGVGKTYTWNDLIKTAAENGELGKGKYSYVSLFGLKLTSGGKIRNRRKFTNTFFRRFEACR